jgi:hypothetical protein
MNPTDLRKTLDLHDTALTRRQFFRNNAMGLGGAALASLLPQELMGAISEGKTDTSHFPARAKRVIYISLIGAPSQFETFDYKPNLKKEFNKDIKDFLVKSGQRLTGMTSKQTKFPVAPVCRFQAIWRRWHLHLGSSALSWKNGRRHLCDQIHAHRCH